MILFDLSYDAVENKVLFVKIGAKVLGMARYVFWAQVAQM